MSGLYIFFLAVGAPLLLWMVFAGDADGGEGLGVDGEGPLSELPFSAIAAFMTVFGGIGLIGELTDTGSGITLLLALMLSALSAWASRRLFGWANASSGSSEVMDAELEGKIAHVSLPVSADFRGKIVVEVAGAREQMTAAPADGSSIEIGEPVVIVRIERGVALIAPIGPELELE